MNSRFAPHLALIACNVTWALNYPFYKLVFPVYITPLAMATSALVVAALISLLTLIFAKREKVDRKDILKFVMAGILMGIARKVFLMTGMAHTSPIDGSIIGTITPLLVLVISVMIHIDRFSPMKIIGLILGMTGAVIIIVAGGSSSHNASTVVGNLLILLCVCSSAFYMVWFKGLISKYSAATVLRWLYCSAALAILPFGLDSVIETNYAAMTHEATLAYIFILLVPTLGPNFLLIYSLKRLPPTISSIYSYIQPIVATSLAIAMHMDKLTTDSIVAAAIIFAGVFFVIRSYHTNIASPIAHFN